MVVSSSTPPPAPPGPRRLTLVPDRPGEYVEAWHGRQRALHFLAQALLSKRASSSLTRRLI
eukprot:7429658-Lingulodinium_polyedra.AAC.1